MKLEEFVRLNPSQIRVDKELMQLFVNYYEAAFSFKPKCAGCSFKSGFKKLKAYSKNNKSNQTIIKMTTHKKNTFQLKSKFRLKILTYKKDGKIYRCYGHNLTEEFAIELVNAGKGDLFVNLPNKRKEVKEIEVIESKKVSGKESFYDLDYRSELVPMYNELKEKTGRKAKSFRKEDIIDFLENEN